MLKIFTNLFLATEIIENLGTELKKLKNLSALCGYSQGG